MMRITSREIAPYTTTSSTDAARANTETKVTSSRSSIPLLLVRHGKNHTHDDHATARLTNEGLRFAHVLTEKMAEKPTPVDTIICTSYPNNYTIKARNRATVEAIPSERGIKDVNYVKPEELRRELDNCRGTTVLCFNTAALAYCADIFEDPDESSNHPVDIYIREYQRTGDRHTNSRETTESMYNDIYHGQYDPSTGKISLLPSPETLKGDTDG